MHFNGGFVPKVHGAHLLRHTNLEPKEMSLLQYFSDRKSKVMFR